MQTPLSDILGCFEGMVPSTLATCAKDGTPNITYLSIVHYVDEQHIALSFQFFNKSRANVLENPRAQVMVVEPQSMRQYRLDVEYQQTQTDGKVFGKMQSTLDSVAAMTGMTDVFKLQGADIYKVLDCKANLTGAETDQQKYQIGHLDALAEMTAKMASCNSLEQLFPLSLEGMSQLFNYDHAMILLPNETRTQLYTIASRGYEVSGVGSEVDIAEGIWGMVAKNKSSVRITHFERDLRLAKAVRSTSSEATQKDIPLPGMSNVQSQLALPLLVQGQLLGVICMESEEPGRFITEDEHVGNVLANHLATCMALLSSEDEEESKITETSSSISDANKISAKIKFYQEDKSLFIDDDYIIKGLPGQILWNLLKTVNEEGRVDFTNREIRLDRSLNLPPVKDNLETRLILLKQRLQERCKFIQFEKTGRGQFRLNITRSLVLESL